MASIEYRDWNTWETEDFVNHYEEEIIERAEQINNGKRATTDDIRTFIFELIGELKEAAAGTKYSLIDSNIDRTLGEVDVDEIAEVVIKERDLAKIQHQEIEKKEALPEVKTKETDVELEL